MKKYIFRCAVISAVTASMLMTMPAFADSATNPEPQGTISYDVKRGDVDNSGKISAADALCSLKHISGLLPKETLSTEAGDINEDGKLSVRDSLILLQNIAGIRDDDLAADSLGKVEYYVPEMYKEGSSFLKEKAVGFYGADGYGKYASGGRGGRVIHVTNLNDSGEGSLRAACEASGKRIVVFDVCGTINLNSDIRVKNGDLTIAGETAPGDGITITKYPMSIQGVSNVIVRYLTCRTGDQLNALGEYNGGEFGLDSMSITNVKNVIIDHVTATWGTDETLSVSVKDKTSYENTSDNVSIQWSMVAESLVNSNNVGRRLGLASLVCGCQGSKYSFHHNIYASHASRMPDVCGGSPNMPDAYSFEFYNNVVYNWASNAPGKNADNDPDGLIVYNTNTSFVNNYYIPGPDTTGNFMYSEATLGKTMYAAGNMMDGKEIADQKSLVTFEKDCIEVTDGTNPYYGKIENWFVDKGAYFREKAFENSLMQNVQTAADAHKDVILYAGNSLSRDALDTGLSEGIENRTAKCIDYPFQASGWPNEQPPTNTGKNYGIWLKDHMPSLAQFEKCTDTDGDGMSDGWEDFMGLDKNNEDDGAASYLGSDYTNLDVYLQFVVENPSANIAR